VRAVYDKGDAAGFVIHHLTKIGPQSFSRRYVIPLDTVESWACGRKRPSAGSVRRVLRVMRVRTVETPRCPVDDRPVFRAGARYCSPKCRATASKRRQRGRANETSREEAAS
jgi:predicted nucleic acid-binding Zn ribbon protein